MTVNGYGEIRSLYSGNSLINSSIINANTAGQTFFLGGTSAFSNLGTLNLSAGTLDLGGTFTTAGLGSFTRTAGTLVNLTGTMNNTGAMLDIGSAGLFKTGGLNSFSGTILGGTLSNTDAVQTALNSSYGTLNGVTLGSNLALAGTGVTLDNLSVSAGSTLTLGSGFSTTQTGINNLGTLNLTSGTLNLGGSFTVANLGSFSRTAGTTVKLTGTLINTGATLDIGAAGLFKTGGLNWFSGTILGGTLVNTDALPTFNSYGTLDGVTIGSNLALSGSTNIANKLTLANATTLNLGSASLYFKTPGAQSLAPVAGGTASITLAGGAIYQNTSSAQTLTLGAGLTVNGYGAIGFQYGDISSLYSGNYLINNSIINANTAAQTLTLGANDIFSNLGTINLSAGTLALGGRFAAADLGVFNRTAGTTVNLSGTLNNTGATLDIGAAGLFKTGGLNVLSGTILGGTLSNTDAVQAALNSSYGWLDGVTIGSNLALTGVASIANKLTLANATTLNLGAASLYFVTPGAQSLAPVAGGTASISLAGGSIYQNASAQALTLGAGLTVNGYGAIRSIYSGNYLINNSIVNANTVAQTLTLGGNDFFSNLGTINLSAGTLALGGTFAAADLGVFNRTAGTSVNLSGTLNNTGAVLDIGSAGLFKTGGINTFSGTILGGTLSNTDAVQTALNSSYGTLNGVTLGSNLALAGTGVTLDNLSVSAGSTLTLGSGFSTTQTGINNLGTLNLTSGTLNLGGSFTAANLGSFSRTAGTTVNLSGTLNNTGATLDIGSAGLFKTGGLNSFSGSILGGTLSNSDAVQTALNSSSGTLDGVTIGSNLALTGTAYIANNLKLASGTTLNLGAGNLYFNNAVAQSLAPVSGSASITLAGGGIHQSNNYNYYNAQTLTLGSGLTISGYGAIDTSYSYYSNNSIINNGIINANTANQTLALGNWYGNWSNSGAINLTAGTVSIYGNGTDSGSYAVSAGANLNFAGGTRNFSAGSSIAGAGTLTISGAAINPNNLTLGINTVAMSGGSWTQIAATLPAFAPVNFNYTGGNFIRALGGNGTTAAPYQLADIYGVQGMTGITPMCWQIISARLGRRPGMQGWVLTRLTVFPAALTD